VKITQDFFGKETYEEKMLASFKQHFTSVKKKRFSYITVERHCNRYHLKFSRTKRYIFYIVLLL